MRKITFLFVIFIVLMQAYFMFFEQPELIKHNVSKSIISISEVVSIGRDDDDGKAKKWHIGGLD